MAGKMGRELILRKALADVDAAHDVILIDCPPALGLLTVNALVAADWALLSAEAQYFALQGVEQALQVIELARDGLNPDLQWLGVRAQHRRHAHRPLARGLRLAEGARRRQAARTRSCASRSPTRSPPSARSRSSSTAPTSATDYVRLADELLGRLGLTAARTRLRAQYNGG